MGTKKRKSHAKRKKISLLTPEKGTYVQRIHKDTLFRYIFRDKKKLLQLYNAINGSSYEDVSGLTVTTVENIIYLGYKNDLSFLLDWVLCLEEDILTDVLRANRKEVVAMFLEDFDDEAYHKLLKKEAREDGFAAGETAGELKGRTEGRIIGRTEGRIIGKTEGVALALLELLESRGEVSDELRERITGQSDMDILKKWLRAVDEIHSVDEFREIVQL